MPFICLLNYMPFVPTYLTYLCALRAYVPLCHELICAYVPTCFKLLRAYVPTCPYFSRAYVPSYFTCLRAYNHSENTFRLTSIPCISVFLWIICRGSHRRSSLRKGVHRNFAKFTGKHLCQSLLFNKVAGLGNISC